MPRHDPGSLEDTGPYTHQIGEGALVYFVFWCFWCGEENRLFGIPRGFWRVTHHSVDSYWDCWSCGGTNETPDWTPEEPWTPAD